MLCRHPLALLPPPYLATLPYLATPPHVATSSHCCTPNLATPLYLATPPYQELEEREEDGKRRDYIHFRGVRGKHEERVTKHGYLCTQRERIAAAYAELIRRVGAGAEAMPSDISVLLQPGYMPRDITERFVTLEATVTSLLNLQEVHRNQMEEIQIGIDELHAEADGLEQGHAGVEAEREAEVQVAAGQARTYARATRTAARDAEVFARICHGVQEVAASAECRLPPALVISGCSQANLEQFLSALHQRLDDIELVGIEMERESSSQNRRAAHGHTFDLARRMGISKDLEAVSKDPEGTSMKEEVGRALKAEEANADTAADAAPTEEPPVGGDDTAE